MVGEDYRFSFGRDRGFRGGLIHACVLYVVVFVFLPFLMPRHVTSFCGLNLTLYLLA